MNKPNSFLPIEPGSIIERDGIRYTLDEHNNWWADGADRHTITKWIDDEQVTVINGKSAPTVEVDLYKPGGKWYTTDYWHIPQGAIGPYDMQDSSDFRRIDNGPVVIPAQEPWGYSHMFP